MANDDTFEENKANPTNKMKARCGVASVECSIAGDFYSYLPEATLLEGYEPQTEGMSVGNDDDVTNSEPLLSIGKCCRYTDEIEGPAND